MLSASHERRQNFKQEYGWFYEALVRLLARADPMNLVKMGAPEDEYELEVDVILQGLNEARSPGDLGQIIYDAFVDCFGSSFAAPAEQPGEQRKARFLSMGNEAWNLWQSWKGEMPQK